MNAKRWAIVFRALANVNRLKIVKLLSDNQRRSVTDISAHLDISLKATSNHLVILNNLDVLDSLGTTGHVYYYLNRQLPKDFQKIVAIILK